MARVTVEDCVQVVPNRFELVVLASQHAKEIALGRATLLPKNNDKPPVIALREIAAGLISVEALRAAVIRHSNHEGLPKQKSVHFADFASHIEDAEEDSTEVVAHKALESAQVATQLYTDVSEEEEEL